MANHPLKMWREAHGVTQQELGAKLDVTKSTVSRYESGERRPRSPKTLTRIKQATGGAVTAEHFYGEGA